MLMRSWLGYAEDIAGPSYCVILLAGRMQSRYQHVIEHRET